jgi:predicted AAA+ superfamily ATPase
VDKGVVRSVRDGLSSAADTGQVSELRNAVDDIESSVENISGIKRGVLDYFGGATRDVDTDEVRRNLELTVYRDIPRYQQFEDRSDLHALCAVAAMYPGQTLGLKDLSEILDCDRRTLQRYIDILEDFFILTPSYQYQYKRRRSVRLYVRDPLLVGALTDIDLEGLLNSEAETRLMKTVVFDHLKRLAFYYHRSNAAVRFWESGTESIDFVIETGQGTPIPIVLAGTGERVSSHDQIDSFCKEHECEFGAAIGRDVNLSVNEGVATLPLWMFLLFI